MCWSVDGRHPSLLTCLSDHVLERGWEPPTFAHLSLCPRARAWVEDTHFCSHASPPMRYSAGGRNQLLLTCLCAHALERGLEAPTFAHVPSYPYTGAWKGGTHLCSRAFLPMRWSVQGRQPPWFTRLLNEVERADAALGKFRQGCSDEKRNTPDMERTTQARCKNISKAVESNVGGGLHISETTVRRLVATKRSRSHVAEMHRPLAPLQHRKIQKVAFEEKFAGHMSCRLV